MRWMMAILAATFCAALAAQDTPKPEPKPEEKPAEKPDEMPTGLGLSAELNPFISKVYPDLDPAGEHDIFKLKNYTDAAKRHEYTGAMTRLVALYVTRLDLGSTVSKLFDHYSRGKEGTQPAFKVMHAVQMLQYPPGTTNWPAAEKLLREAAASTPDFAYPWYFLGEVEIAKLRAGMASGPDAAFDVVNNALKIKPDFFAAVLLKCDLLMSSRPPKSAEALKLIEPVLAKDAPTASDLENLLRSYSRITSPEKMLTYIEEVLKRPSTKPALRASACAVAADVMRQNLNLDAALEWMEKGIKDVDPATDPEAAVRSRHFLAEVWGMKAVRMREKDPALAGENRKLFDASVAQARKDFESSADMEKKFMPLELRGVEAARYISFLVSIGELEDALLWVDNYLANTDLPGTARNNLERMQLQIRTRIDPNEDILVEQYQDLVDREEVEGLVVALDGARQNLEMRGLHFKTKRALKFFIEQLKHRDRRIVMLATLLCADTAKEAGGDSVAEAGKALAERFEAEIECKSDDQSYLQAGLCKALLWTDSRGGGDPASQARAARHVKKLVEGMGSARVGIVFGRVVTTFVNTEFQATVKDAPTLPSSSARGRTADVAEWMSKLAEALDKMAQK